MRIEAKNLNKVTQELDSFGNYLTKALVDDAAKAIFATFRKAERDLFATGGHGRWPELSPDYAAWKEKHYPGKGLMVREETLRDSLTRKTSDTVNYASKTGRKWHIHMGTTVEHAKYHKKGIPSKKGKVVRKAIDPTDQQIDKWADILQSKCYSQARRYPTAFTKATPTKMARVDKRG